MFDTDQELDADLLMPVRATAFEHQKKAFRFILHLFQVLTGMPPISRGAALLFEMGCGKTLVAIAVAGTLYQFKKASRLLIVAPLSILAVWETEFERFADLPYTLSVLNGTPEKKRTLISEAEGPGLNVLLVNYESAWRLENELLAYDADLVIADEAHKIKENRTHQSKTLHRLGHKARYRLLLTGTLIANREIDVFSQYLFLNPGIFGESFYQFRNKYFTMAGYGQHTPVFREDMTADFLQRLHCIAYRVTKDECLDLPEVVDEIRTVQLEDAALKLYKKIEEDSYAELRDGEISAPNVLTRLLRLLQISGGHVTDDDGAVRKVSNAKMEALEDILDAAQAEGQKVTIMARFTAELDDIEDMLTRKKIDYAVIRGGIKHRGEQITRFQNDPGCTVFLGQIAAAGLGLTLTAASLMVFYSWDYSMSNHDQARARIHRAGQRNACTYIYLCAKGTIDRRVIQALRNKQEVARMLVDDYRMGLNPYRA